MNYKLFHRIFVLLKPWLPSQILGLVLTILVSITIFVAPLVSKYFIDEVIPSHSIENLYRGLLIFASVSLSQPIFGYFNTIVFLRLGQNISRSMSYRSYSRVITAPMPFIDKKEKGKFISRILSDSSLASEFITDFFIEILKNVVQIIMVITGMIYLSFKITLIVL